MYRVFIEKDALSFVNSLPEKSKAIVKDNLKQLKRSPHPGRGKGDKEKLVHRGKGLYRMHIGRTFTAFYSIYEEEQTVKILKVMTIEQAHKKYGML